MKRSYLIVLCSLVLFACGNESQPEKKEEKNTVPAVVSKDTSGLKIAYYQLDSLRSQFKYYKQQDEVVSQRQLAFQKEVEKRTAEYEKYLIQKDAEAKRDFYLKTI